ncbi:hypothetical protein [Sphingomonas sp. OK281]|uniref:hypothetical protein n=1 Tax=Sphingomonas sp. OK281 TaxID=1881067 RepID=UPI001587EAFE|nr:hypothetical protein [Sphingomonas sp. OK281]
MAIGDIKNMQPHLNSQSGSTAKMTHLSVLVGAKAAWLEWEGTLRVPLMASWIAIAEIAPHTAERRPSWCPRRDDY